MARNNKPRRRALRGFTLIEISIVAGAMGILLAIGTINFLKFTARAKRAEAYAGLAAIAMAEAGYKSETDSYSGSFYKLGVKIDPGLVVSDHLAKGDRYNFMLSSDGATWCAVAAGNIDSDPFMDIVYQGNGCFN